MVTMCSHAMCMGSAMEYLSPPPTASRVLKFRTVGCIGAYTGDFVARLRSLFKTVSPRADLLRDHHNH